jgi:hypothetical protein
MTTAATGANPSTRQESRQVVVKCQSDPHTAPRKP